MNTFEDNLKRLETLTNDIKRPDISLEDALKDFEEGIKLASGMEKELNKIEGKIQVLMNNPNPESSNYEKTQFDLFTDADSETGTSGAPVTGTRQ